MDNQFNYIEFCCSSLEPESLCFNCSSKLEEGDLISLSLINYDNRGLAELSAKPHEEKYLK